MDSLPALRCAVIACRRLVTTDEIHYLIAWEKQSNDDEWACEREANIKFLKTDISTLSL